MGQIGSTGVAGQAIPWPRCTKVAPPFSPTLLGGGVRVPPSPYIKAPQGEEENTPRPRVGSSPASSMRLPPLSPPLLPVWLPEGLRRNGGQLHWCTPSCCGNSGSDPNRSTFAISAESEIWRLSSFTVCVRVLRGAILCGTKSLRQCCRNIKIYTILRSASLASSSTLVRERNRRVRSTRVCH
jgi:hypothetical protein